MLTSLGAKLVAALVLVALVTTALTAVTLLSPLEQRLRDDRLDTLSQVLHAERPALEPLAKADRLPPNSPALRQELRRLRRRSLGGEVVAVGPAGQVLGTEDNDPPIGVAAGVRALRRGEEVRMTVQTPAASFASVALPLPGRRVAVVLSKPLAQEREAARVVRKAFIPAAAISLGIAVLLGAALARRLVRRLVALRDAALRIARTGADEPQPLPPAGRDEVGDLTRAVATMQVRLAEQERARRAFVSTASHELRTPLSSLQIVLDLLRSDLETEPVARDDALRQTARAEAQTEALAKLAADLLDLSRLDAGRSLRTEPVELDEVARSVLAELETRAAAAGRELVLSGGADDRWALADPGAVAQIVRLLVDNALRHAPAGSPVTVTLAGGSESVTLSVADEGPGVPPDERERIFERFERGAAASSTSGFGLGLPIGRELASLMGGTLQLAPSERGARFVLSLPRYATSPPSTIRSAASAARSTSA